MTAGRLMLDGTMCYTKNCSRHADAEAARTKELLSFYVPQDGYALHPFKNAQDMSKYSPGSAKVAWWLGSCGHEWDRVIREQHKFGNCPYCSGKRALAGFNDLLTTHPIVAKEWHPTKNGDLKPSQFTAGSNQVIIWLCEHGHDWPSPISKRTDPSRSTNRGCPTCKNKRVERGINDFPTTHPEIASEWSLLNEKLASEYTAGSHQSGLWDCKAGKGHPAYRNSIKNRANRNQGCPECVGASTSNIENVFRVEATSFLSLTHAASSERLDIPWRKRSYMNVDIIGVFKGKKVVIEYDGERYHREEKYKINDVEKTKVLIEHGYKVIRIREQPLALMDYKDSSLLQLSYSPYKGRAGVQAALAEVQKWLSLPSAGQH